MTKVKLKTIVRKEYKPTVIGTWAEVVEFPGSRVNTITNELFAVSLNIFLGSKDDFKKLLTKTYDYKDFGSKAYQAVFVSFEFDDRKWNWINIPQMEFTAEDYGLYVHELHHFVHIALQNCGHRYDIDTSEELYASTIGWFMEMSMRAFAQLRIHEAGVNTKKKTKK